jgi:hypothetical protein
MSKKRSSRNAISSEEAREAVKARRYDVTGVFQPDPDEVERLLQQFESVDYVVLVDLHRLLFECERLMIERLKHLESAYATGLPMEVVRALLLSLLRIPPAQRDIDDRTDRAQTEEEVQKLRKAVRAAAKIARETNRRIEADGSPPSLEKVDRMIRDADDSEAVRAQLELARAGDPPITLNDNQQLPVIAAMPKSLMSEHKYKVEMTVGGLNDARREAEVTVVRLVEDEDMPLALQGLIGVPTRATFVPDRRGKVRRTLLGAQLTDKPVVATVEVTRGFRASDTKYNALTIGKLNGNPELASAMEQAATQLKLDLVP